MNNVSLVGRLIADPELKTTQGGIEYCRFSVAVDRPPNGDGRREADFIRCVAWRKTAIFVANYFTKGKRIGLTGHIQTGSYEKNGVKQYTTDIVAEKVEFVESKTQDGQSTRDSGDDHVPFEQAGFMPVSDDELPF